MVHLKEIACSNALISKHLPPNPVAVFVGGTSGIGRATLQSFVLYTKTLKPRIYIIGRSQSAADTIIAESRTKNPNGVYTFYTANVSLMKVVDQVCGEIGAREKRVDVLVLSAGEPRLDRSQTCEGLHYLASLVYYSRMRFIIQLLPLLSKSSLAHVVFIAGGTLEGPLDTTDYQGLRIPLMAIRGHLSSLITLGLAGAAKRAPGVVFIHSHPGIVKTRLVDRHEGLMGYAIRAYIRLLGRWIAVPIEESGERHTYLATSARFAVTTEASDQVPIQKPLKPAEDWLGSNGSGVFTVGWNCENAASAKKAFYCQMKDNGLVEAVWRHTEEEFWRITGDYRHQNS